MSEEQVAQQGEGLPARGKGEGHTVRRFALGAALLMAYTLAFVPLYRVVGPGAEAFAAIVVLAAAFGFGKVGGVVMAGLCIVVHGTGYSLVLELAPAEVFIGGSMPVNLLLPVLGLAVGHLRELRESLEREVEERRVTEAHLTRARHEAEAANRAKGDFLARMSHEIRTPMNGVIGLSRLVLPADISGESRSYMEMIQSSGNALLLIINDILDFSKVEAGRLELDETDFDLVPVTSEVMNIMAMQASPKGVEVALLKSAGLPERVHGDPSRLRQVLLNLVGNAVKFSSQGEVVVELSVVVHEETVSIVRCEVRDKGIGIAPEALGRIFEPFRQADGSTTQRYGGTGLGLAISKQLVELMGGRIGCQSRPGKGSTFWFELPMERRQPVVEEEQELPPEVERLSHARALLVAIRVADQSMALRLQNFGMTVERADAIELGHETLAVAADEGEPMAMCVVVAESSEGWPLAFARRARADHRHDDVALVLLTVEEPGSGREVEDAGFAAWFGHYTDQVTLCEGLAAALDVPRRKRGGRKRAFLVTRHRMNERRARSRARVLVAEDNQVNQIIAAKLLEQSGLLVDVVGNGKEAVVASGARSYDAIFMDCRMPEMDGLAATAAIRAREEQAGGHVPIVALTAAAMQGDREQCLAAGMDDHVTKPIDPDALARAVSRWIPLRRRSGHSSGFSVPQQRISSLPVEPRALDRLRSAGGQEVVAVAIEGFLKGAPVAFDDLRLAARMADGKTLGSVAHRFKGSCGAVGARQMADMCQQLETLESTGDLASAMPLIERLETDFEMVAEALAGYRNAGSAANEPPNISAG